MRRKVVIALAVGSIPGSICGVKLLMHIRHLYGDGVNSFIKTAVGVLLIVIPTLLLFQSRIEERVVNRPPTMKVFAGMSVIGLVAGFLVGMTSVGSGSIIMMLLLLFYSFPPKVMVGTDIVHAVILTGVTSLAALPPRQRRSRAGRLAADWLDPRRAARFASGHARPRAVAAATALRGAAGHRRPHAVGLILRNSIHAEHHSGKHDLFTTRHSAAH